MFGDRAVSIYDLNECRLKEIFKGIQASDTFAQEIEDHVKVFARLDSTGELSYARENKDLGTQITTKFEICQRLSLKVREEVLSALTSFESVIVDLWPFLPGSYSWLEVQIKIADKVIEVKRAVSISTAGKTLIKTNRVQKEMLRSSLWGLEKSINGWLNVCGPGKEIIPLPESVFNSFLTGQVTGVEMIDIFIEANSPMVRFYIFTDREKIIFDKTRKGKLVASSVVGDLPPPPLAGFLS